MQLGSAPNSHTTVPVTIRNHSVEISRESYELNSETTYDVNPAFNS
jgi:hypothetical protein